MIYPNRGAIPETLTVRLANKTFPKLMEEEFSIPRKENYIQSCRIWLSLKPDSNHSLNSVVFSVCLEMQKALQQRYLSFSLIAHSHFDKCIFIARKDERKKLL